MTGEEQDVFCAISDAMWGGELGWVDNLPKFKREAVYRIKDRDFWKHMEQKTTSLDALKAQFMQDMLKTAVKHLRAPQALSWCRDAREFVYPGKDVREFLELYDTTWGKEDE